MSPDPPDDGELLLYYQYLDLRAAQSAVCDWMRSNCASLGLVGRVRVAQDGISSTLGGIAAAIAQHVAAVQSHPLLGGQRTDFKVAPWPRDCSAKAAAEAGFNTLSVSSCKEVVALGETVCDVGCLPELAGAHISPQNFDAMLADPEGPTVLVDARNVYESRIGRFEAEGVEVLQPRTRTFSELPGWLAANRQRLAHKRVLMYCTGGVRCERASAYVRSLGNAFQDVHQLEGGIVRYLDSHPDGGHFVGKNFVYDPRCSVGPLAPRNGHGDVIGRCFGCGKPCDDYTPRCRCSACRLLVLVCDTCRSTRPQTTTICELCAERQLAVCAEPQMAGKPRLRILCLHGFRQTASQFRGRTAALQRKLKDLAELVFVDAPHAITTTRSNSVEAGDVAAAHPVGIRRAWLKIQQSGGQDTDAGDEQQRRQQTEGWPASEAALQDVLQHQGPFDGVLGFSQGAAVAAALCAQQQHQTLLARTEAAASLRFAILCSGYPSAAAEHRALHAEVGQLRLPTLHVFGSDAAQNQTYADYSDHCSHQHPAPACDHEVSAAASRQLLDLCDQRLCHVVAHGNGHIIPVDKRLKPQNQARG